MTGTENSRPRQGLFRAIALERYRGPLQLDVPHTLPPWRPGLVIAAAAIGLAVALFWL